LACLFQYHLRRAPSLPPPFDRDGEIPLFFFFRQRVPSFPLPRNRCLSLYTPFLSSFSPFFFYFNYFFSLGDARNRCNFSSSLFPPLISWRILSVSWACRGRAAQCSPRARKASPSPAWTSADSTGRGRAQRTLPFPLASSTTAFLFSPRYRCGRLKLPLFSLIQSIPSFFAPRVERPPLSITLQSEIKKVPFLLFFELEGVPLFFPLWAVVFYSGPFFLFFLPSCSTATLLPPPSFLRFKHFLLLVASAASTGDFPFSPLLRMISFFCQQEQASQSLPLPIGRLSFD